MTVVTQCFSDVPLHVFSPQFWKPLFINRVSCSVDFFLYLFRSVRATLNFPLVFVVSESQHSLASPLRLFPPSVTSTLIIFTIRCLANQQQISGVVQSCERALFVYVALTNLTKMLHRLALLNVRNPYSLYTKFGNGQFHSNLGQQSTRKHRTCQYINIHN